MNWTEASEITAGLVITNRLSPNAVRPDIFQSPYCDLIKAYKNGVTQPEELMEQVGLGAFQAALQAEASVNGAGDAANWVAILEKSHAQYTAGTQLERIGRKMQRGDGVDLSKVNHTLSQFQQGKTGRVPLADVEGSRTPFIKTGWEPFDKHVGGLPKVGLIVVGGNPGVGKTSFMAKMACRFAVEHPDKRVGVYSLEMILEEVAMRFREVDTIDTNAESRIEINADPLTVDEVVTDAASIENLGLIIVDFADYLVRGAIDENAMGSIYRTLAIGSKQLGCPIILLSQLNRSYQGGLPRPSQIRYTSLAEALAWMLIMLYNPMASFYDDSSEQDLPKRRGRAYICVWKIRGGFRKHQEEAPGAIELGFDGAKGWSDGKSRWHMLT